MELLSLCLLLFLAKGCLAADIECMVLKSDPCWCTTASGNLTLDLNDLFHYPVSATTTLQDYTYTYRACEAKPCSEGGKAARLCQQSGENFSFNIGVDIDSWTITKLDPLEFVIHYTGGDGGRQSTVTFQYETGDNKFEFVSGRAGVYTFTVTGKGVAPYAPPHPPFTRGHGGAIAAAVISIILIAIIAMVAYCAIGGLIKYYHYGARGVETIPNYTFWKDLKTGVLVATTCTSCYKTERGDYQKLP